MEYLHGLFFIRRGATSYFTFSERVCGLQLRILFKKKGKEKKEEVKTVRDLSRQQVFKGGMERGRRFKFAIH